MKRITLLLLICISITAFGQTEVQIQSRADSLHNVFFSIDTHNDYAIFANHPDSEDYSVEKGQVSFKMMKEGGLDASVFAIYLGQKGRSEDSLKIATQYAIDEINIFKKMVADSSDVAEMAYSSEDLLRIKKEGKRAVLLGIENGYALGKDISNVEMFYNMGVRVITLCHFGDNDICDSANKSEGKWGGLSPFGYEVIAEMNRLGMIIDLSHASRETVFDCIKASTTPVVATHSGVFAIKEIPRNLTDKEIIDISEKGGFIGLATGRYFLSTLPKKEVTYKHIIDHVDYIKNLVGPEHIGIGSDFDGGGGVVGFENMSKMKELTKEMIRRGYSDYDIECFWGGNFLRVFRIVERNKK